MRFRPNLHKLIDWVAWKKFVKTGRFIQMVSSSEVIIIKFAEFVVGKQLKSRFGS